MTPARKIPVFLRLPVRRDQQQAVGGQKAAPQLRKCLVPLELGEPEGKHGNIHRHRVFIDPVDTSAQDPPPDLRRGELAFCGDEPGELIDHFGQEKTRPHGGIDDPQAEKRLRAPVLIALQRRRDQKGDDGPVREIHSVGLFVHAVDHVGLPILQQEVLVHQLLEEGPRMPDIHPAQAFMLCDLFLHHVQHGHIQAGVRPHPPRQCEQLPKTAARPHRFPKGGELLPQGERGPCPCPGRAPPALA